MSNKIFFSFLSILRNNFIISCFNRKFNLNFSMRIQNDNGIILKTTIIENVPSGMKHEGLIQFHDHDFYSPRNRSVDTISIDFRDSFDTFAVSTFQSIGEPVPLSWGWFHEEGSDETDNRLLTRFDASCAVADFRFWFLYRGTGGRRSLGHRLFPLFYFPLRFAFEAIPRPEIW